MTRAVVTGASGFLGGSVVHALRSRGDDVVGLDRRRGPGVVLADTSRPGDWERHLSGADLLVHAAAIGTGGFADPSPVAGPAAVGRDSAALLDPDEIWRNNVDGTAAVLAAARRADIARVVHLSSISALAGAGTTASAAPLTEDTEPAHTGDVLTDALAAAEREARIDSRAPWVVVVRVGDAYGPRAGRWTLRPVALMRAGRFALVDGGRGLLSPIHIDDVADGVLALAETKAALGRVVHLSAATPVPASAFFGRYARMLELDDLPSVSATVARGLSGLAGRSFLPAAGRRGGLTGRLVSRADPRVRFDTGAASLAELTRRSTFSIARIDELAGWQPRYDLDAGMVRTEERLRERGLLGVREPTRRG